MTQSDDQPTITVTKYAGVETLSTEALIWRLEDQIVEDRALGLPTVALEMTLRGLVARVAKYGS